MAPLAGVPSGPPSPSPPAGYPQTSNLLSTLPPPKKTTGQKPQRRNCWAIWGLYSKASDARRSTTLKQKKPDIIPGGGGLSPNVKWLESIQSWKKAAGWLDWTCWTHPTQPRDPTAGRCVVCWPLTLMGEAGNKDWQESRPPTGSEGGPPSVVNTWVWFLCGGPRVGQTFSGKLRWNGKPASPSSQLTA